MKDAESEAEDSDDTIFWQSENKLGESIMLPEGLWRKIQAKARECETMQPREILPEHEHPNIKDQIGDEAQ